MVGMLIKINFTFKKFNFTSRITSLADSVAVVLFWKLFKAGKDGVSQAISIIMP